MHVYLLGVDIQQFRLPPHISIYYVKHLFNTILFALHFLPSSQTSKPPTGSNGLPVYTDFKGQGLTKVITVLKKCGGDINALKADMEKVTGAEVEVRPGKLVVKGNYVRRIKMWLSGLGF